LSARDQLGIYAGNLEDLRDYDDNVELVQSGFMNRLRVPSTVIDLINSMTPVRRSFLQQPIAIQVMHRAADIGSFITNYMQGEMLLSLHFYGNYTTIEIAGHTDHNTHHLLRTAVEFTLQQAPSLFKMSTRVNTLLLITVPRSQMLRYGVYRVMTVDVEAYEYADDYADNVNTQGVLLSLRRDFDLSGPVMSNSGTGNLFSASFWIRRTDQVVPEGHQPFVVVESFTYVVNDVLSTDMESSIRLESACHDVQSQIAEGV